MRIVLSVNQPSILIPSTVLDRNSELPTIPDVDGWVIDRIKDGTNIVGNWMADKATDSIGNKIGNTLGDLASALINLLNSYSSEIITTGIIFMGFGMMIGPLIGRPSEKWFGGMMIILWGGVVWRLII